MCIRDSFTIVTASYDTILDGFYIKDGIRGVDCTGSNSGIGNCIIENNVRYGLYCNDVSIKVSRCVIKNNGYDGIYSSGSGKKLTVNNCKIFDNGENGIRTSGSTALIKNSEIHHNGRDKVNNYDNGIRIDWPYSAGAIRNCTIFRNEGHGVYFSGLSANKPDIRNCIFYNNNYHDDLTQFYGGLTAHYCSVTDPADPNSTNCTKYGDNNMKCDPGFAYININEHNLHLASDSPCIDAADETVIGVYEVDIDGDNRIDDTNVDMGSDEVSCTDEISNSLDWNGDGLVNDREYDIFAKAWLSYDPDEYTGDDPNDTLNWDHRCDLNNDHHINYVDFAFFAKEWLWKACWRASGSGVWMMMGGGMDGMMGGESIPMDETSLLSPATQQQVSETQPEPSASEQIEMVKRCLQFWYRQDVREGIEDQDAWLRVVTSLEEMLKELEAE